MSFPRERCRGNYLHALNRVWGPDLSERVLGAHSAAARPFYVGKSWLMFKFEKLFEG